MKNDERAGALRGRAWDVKRVSTLPRHGCRLSKVIGVRAGALPRRPRRAERVETLPRDEPMLKGKDRQGTGPSAQGEAERLRPPAAPPRGSESRRNTMHGTIQRVRDQRRFEERAKALPRATKRPTEGPLPERRAKQGDRDASGGQGTGPSTREGGQITCG